MSMLEFNKTKMRRNLRHAKKHCLVWEEGVLTCRKRNPSLGMFFHRGLNTVWRISRVLNIFWPSGCALGPKNIQNSLDPSNSISTSVKKHSAWQIFFSACRDSSSQTKNIYSSILLLLLLHFWAVCYDYSFLNMLPLLFLSWSKPKSASYEMCDLV